MTELILKEFKNNIIDFLDELIEQFPEETDIVIGRIYIKDRISADELMSNFIKSLVPFRQRIVDEDDIFFMENAGSLFSSSNSSRVNHFKVIWKSSKLQQDDRKVIWSWFKAFLHLADKFVAVKSKK